MSAQWSPANNGAGKRTYFLMCDDSELPIEDRYHSNSRGDLIRYKSYDTARRAADRLNGQQS